MRGDPGEIETALGRRDHALRCENLGREGEERRGGTKLFHVKSHL